MNRNFAAFALIWIAASPLARAAAIDAVTLTPAGTNTLFEITGTYPPTTATTAYSAPNTPYSLTFVLPTAPTTLAFVDDVNGIFAVDTAVTVNGVHFVNSQVAFFTPTLGGGLDVCLNEGCGPFPPTLFYRWATFGDQLFTGSVDNPVFIAGTPFTDTTQSFIEAPVPEPSTLALSAAIVGLLLFKKRGGAGLLAL